MIQICGYSMACSSSKLMERKNGVPLNISSGNSERVATLRLRCGRTSYHIAEQWFRWYSAGLFYGGAPHCTRYRTSSLLNSPENEGGEGLDERGCIAAQTTVAL